MDAEQSATLKAWLESPEYARGAKLLDGIANRSWYRNQGFRHDVGFQRDSDRSHRVHCVICRQHGAGASGNYWELLEKDLINRWQVKCMAPHTEECACGRFYPSKHALAMHVTANKRHRIPGHGRLDKVG